MQERAFYALEFRELNAIRWQCEKDGKLVGFRITESGLIPVDPDDDRCDLAVGRSAVYLYAPHRPAIAKRGRAGFAVAPRQRDALDLLAQLAEFDSLSDAQLKELAERAERHAFPPHTVIVSEGEAGNSLFVIAEGTVKVSSHQDRGRPDAELSRLAPGACFGEMSLLTGAPRCATVEAENPVVVYEITKAHLAPLMQESDGLVAALSVLMAERQLAQAHRSVFQALASNEERGAVQNFAEKLRDFFGLNPPVEERS